MATQNTGRQADQLRGEFGTLIRDITPASIFYIEPQINVFGSLAGGTHIGPNGKEVTSPKVLKTTQVKSWLVENFTNERLNRTYKVTSGATASGTAITVSVADAATVHVNTLAQVAETSDVVYVTAVDTVTGVLTVLRLDGSVAISVDSNLITLGQIQDEISSSLPFIIRTEDNQFTHTAIFTKNWKRSVRESEVGRYGGKTYDLDRNTQRRDIMADIEANFFGSRLQVGLDGGSATTMRGLEQYASDSGQLFDFGGSVERSELRPFGNRIADFTARRLLLFASRETISVIEASMDDHLRLGPSDLAKGNFLPEATKMMLGRTIIEAIPTNFYSLPGKEGTGIVFDVDRVDMPVLTPLRLAEAKDFEDHTQESSRAGQWYADMGIRALDGGKGITKFTGALVPA